MMLRQDAFSFGKAISELWLMETICDRSADFLLDDQQIADTKQRVHQVLQYTSQICVASSLADHIGPEITRFQNALEVEPLKQAAARCDHLRERLLDELKKRVLLLCRSE